jgi:hypothetical protein
MNETMARILAPAPWLRSDREINRGLCAGLFSARSRAGRVPFAACGGVVGSDSKKER